MWRDGRNLELMDPTVGYPSSSSIMLRFINIGLLCVQESPTDRPTMLDVVLMISNEHALLPTPKQPTFITFHNMMDTNSTVDNAENYSKNSVTISTMEARWPIPIPNKINVVEPIFLYNLYAYWYATYLSLKVVLVHLYFSFVCWRILGDLHLYATSTRRVIPVRSTTKLLAICSHNKLE